MTLRYGMYGGGFDPPHNAHVAIAGAAIAQLQLNQLFIVPTGGAYHKPRQLSAARHRLAMSRLAFAKLPRATVSAVELEQTGSSYTVETLAVLDARHPGARWFIVIGTDQAHAFSRWHRWADILRRAEVAVVPRPGEAAHWRAEDPLPGTGAAASAVHVIRLPAMDGSASAIRARVAAGLPVDASVPGAVARYIETHHLYQKRI